jgi:hypothetical protein
VRKLVSAREALADPQLLGNCLVGESWAMWRMLLMALMGEELTPEELDQFESVTGRKVSPTSPVEEAALLIGRRGGKDRAVSVLNAYLAGCCDHSDVLAAGERASCLCIAPDMRQARYQLNFVDAAFTGSPVLNRLVTGRTADTLSLSNKIDIECRAASYRRLRGMTCIAVTVSEGAFFFTDEHSSNADVEILGAVRPTLSTTGPGPLIQISTPYRCQGELYECWRDHYGPEGDPAILVARAGTRVFNPKLSQRVIDRALAKDFAKASCEYLVEWRSDLETLLSREAIAAVTSTGVLERPPLDNVKYFCFCDMASGSGSDSAALGIAHLEDKIALLDCVRERKPRFSPEAVISEFCDLMRAYRIATVVSDKWAPGFTREAFARHGIVHQPSPKTTSELYSEFLPKCNSGEVSLLDVPRVLSQFIALERKTGQTGKDNISHPQGAHDDLACCCAGSLWLAATSAVAQMTFAGGGVIYQGDAGNYPAFYNYPSGNPNRSGVPITSQDFSNRNR